MTTILLALALMLAAGTMGCEETQASAAEPMRTDSDAPAFFGEPDADRIASLRNQPITAIKKGKGGRSLGFKLTLADGTQGYFKPEQSFSAAHWYSEVAAYYLDRALGLGRVSPTTGRRFAWEPLRRAAKGDSRIDEIKVDSNGTVRGAFIWWIPEPLKRLELGRGWERWIRVQRTLPITPYQRPADYRADLNKVPGTREANDPKRPRAGEPDTEDRAAELSDMIVFDYLIQNVDRWGGNFTNVRTRRLGGPLIYLDNGAGFWLGQQELGLLKARLKALQRFRRTMVDAVARLDVDALAARMASDPLAPVLNQRQVAGLRARQKAFVAHVNRMKGRFGEASVLAW